MDIAFRFHAKVAVIKFAQFGKQGLIELTLTMGNYALIAIAVNSFDSELPANRTEPVLPV